MRRTTGLVLILVCLAILVHDAGSGRFSVFRAGYSIDDLNRALLESVEGKAWDKAWVLVERGADVNMRCEYAYEHDVPLFYIAALHGPRDFVGLCIEAGADVNATNRWGWTALGAAVVRDRLDIVALLLNKGVDLKRNSGVLHGAGVRMLDFLLSKGADINGRDWWGTTPLHEASREGRREIVEFLIRHGADVGARMCCDESLLEEGHVSAFGDNGWTPLHQAAFHGHTEVGLLLVKAGADPNAKDDWGKTPLHYGAHEGQKDVVGLLIRLGADVNARDKCGQTPLHEAAHRDQKETARLLIENGADVNARSKGGWSPLHSAAYTRAKGTAELLVKSGANVNATDSEGRTPLYTVVSYRPQGLDTLFMENGATVGLHEAVGMGRRDIVHKLVFNGADLNGTIVHGETALGLATRLGKWDIVRLLIEMGAKPIPDRRGYTPLHWAASKGEKGVVQLLIANGADVHASANGGTTALHLAAAGGRKEVAQLLILEGARVDANEGRGWQPLHYAAQSNAPALAEVLIGAGGNVNATDVDHRTPLDWASTPAMKEWLRQHGAKSGKELDK